MTEKAYLVENPSLHPSQPFEDLNSPTYTPVNNPLLEAALNIWRNASREVSNCPPVRKESESWLLPSVTLFDSHQQVGALC
jgi:hypothetical protein